MHSVDASLVRSVSARAHAARRSHLRQRRLNMFDDTWYRRARQAVVRAIHAVDDAVSTWRHERLHVLFEAASPRSVAVFRPVLDRLRRDPRLTLWFTTSDRAWQPAQIFNAPGLS